MHRLAAFVLLALLTSTTQAGAPKKVLFLSQAPDGHPPQTHEYIPGLRILEKCLDKVPGLEIVQLRADEPWRDGPELLSKADGAVLFLAEGGKWLHQDPRRLEAFQKLAARKGGLAALHWAIGAKDAKNIQGFVDLFGGCHGGPDRKYKVLTAETAPQKHPVTAGVKPLNVRDEFYYTLKFTKAPGLSPILRVPIDANDETVAWAWERPDGGRSFGFSGLHFHENWRHPEYRRLAAQGVLWSLGLNIPPDGLPVVVGDADLKTK